ncbi:MAG: hypothetical protein NTV87_08880 [Ignavibacteriae bacterium]|nr:hypothetical protein [Ignavibacteriota bacterium]
MKKLLFLSIFVFSLTGVVLSQSIGENLQKVGAVYSAMYLQSFADALGTNLNSNYFYSAYVPFDKKKPITPHVGFRIRMMGTFLSDADQKFNYSYRDYGNTGGGLVMGTYRVVNAPTVLGDKTPAVAKFYDDNGNYYPVNDYTLIGGVINTKTVPFAMPEITFGSLYGTDASFIILPPVNISNNVGKFSIYGFTIRHNLSHYLKKSPVDFAVQGGYQKMYLTESNNNDLWKSTNFFVNGQVSKTYKFVTGYAALQYETYTADINYIQTGLTTAPKTIAFSLTGNNRFRGVIGAAVRAGFFVFNLDANIGNRFALSAGMNFIIL